MRPLDAALSYAERGWAVFPCLPRSRVPYGGTHGHHDASTDPVIIKRWWDRWPDATVSIATGKSGLLIVDVDGEYGKRSLLKLMAEYAELPDTASVRSGGGGLHFYFRVAEQCRSGFIAEKLECKAHAIVAPPSLHHRTGEPYRWLDKRGPAVAPEWLVDICRRKVVELDIGEIRTTTVLTEYGKRALLSAARNIIGAPDGLQEKTLCGESYGIGRGVGAGLIPQDLALQTLIAAGMEMPNHRRDKWKLRGSGGVEAKVAGNLRRGMAVPRLSPDEKLAADERYMDAVNEEYLRERH